MKNFKILLLLVAAISSFYGCQNQPKEMDILDKTDVTIKDILEIRLQILAAQMTCGSYRILDMGIIHYPINIRIDDNKKIIIEIVGDPRIDLSKDIQEEIMSEAFLFAQTGINELFLKDFPKIEFDVTKDIAGYWYLENAHEPCAKWENSTLSWIE